eukprot:3779974-Amphidinium_carterae.1
MVAWERNRTLEHLQAAIRPHTGFKGYVQQWRIYSVALDVERIRRSQHIPDTEPHVMTSKTRHLR